jgi:hypothetical protein
MPSQKPSHGGRRKGAGRKPAKKPAKRPASVRLATDVADYLDCTANRSTAVEGAVRASLGYRLWMMELSGKFVRLSDDAPAPECED